MEFIETFNNFTVKLVCESDLTTDEMITLHKATRHMAITLGGADFERFCRMYHYSYTTSTGYLWWAKRTRHIVEGFKLSEGRTGAQVHHHLMKGAEILRPDANNTADITLVVDRRNKRGVLGYTYPNSVKQWVYSWLLRTDYRRVAGNLAHEWCHKMGYGHEFRYNSTRKHTVPYAVGDFVGGIVR